MASFAEIIANYERKFGVDTTVTLRTLALGAADSTTGWYAKDLTTTTSSIDMIITEPHSTFTILGIGYYSEHLHQGFTASAVTEGSEIYDSTNTRYYEVQTATPIPLGTTIFCYRCGLSYDPLHADRPSTSGTWTSAGSTANDPAQRLHNWLDTYLTAANMKKDNNADNMSTLVGMGMPDYPIAKIFLPAGSGGKDHDLVFSIHRSRTTAAHIGYDKIITHYREEVPVHVLAIDKSGVTGRRAVWAGEAEIRRIAGTAAGAIGTGSVRTYNSGRENFQHLGSTMLYDLEVTVEWVRDAT